MSVKSHRARARRAWLRDRLGGRCAFCGTTLDLQFDLKVGDGAEHHGMSSHDRALFYIKEFNRGNLQLLCGLHNREKWQKEERERKARALCASRVPSA